MRKEQRRAAAVWLVNNSGVASAARQTFPSTVVWSPKEKKTKMCEIGE